MTVLDLPAPPGNPLARLRWAVYDGLVVAVRNLKHIRQVPDKLLNATISPIMFVLLFAYVFGSAITVRGGNYRDFLMPGIFVQTVAFTCATTAMGVANDMTKGLVDRFRVVVFPVFTGSTGRERIYDGYPDVALNMISSCTFDGRIQLLEYAPAILSGRPGSAND